MQTIVVLLAQQVALAMGIAITPLMRPRVAPVMMYATGDETTVSGYLAALENRVAALADEAGRAVPARCIGDACLSVSEYISVLESAASELQQPEMHAPIAPAKAVPADGSLNAYVASLESKVQALSDKLGEAVPQFREEATYSGLQAYIEMLEQRAVVLERQCEDTDGCDVDELVGPGGSITAYLTNLENKVAMLTEQLGSAAPSRCVGDACLDLQSYVDLLEDTAATLEKQWATQQGSTW